MSEAVQTELPYWERSIPIRKAGGGGGQSRDLIQHGFRARQGRVKPMQIRKSFALGCSIRLIAGRWVSYLLLHYLHLHHSCVICMVETILPWTPPPGVLRTP